MEFRLSYVTYFLELEKQIMFPIYRWERQTDVKWTWNKVYRLCKKWKELPSYHFQREYKPRGLRFQCLRLLRSSTSVIFPSNHPPTPPKLFQDKGALIPGIRVRKWTPPNLLTAKIFTNVLSARSKQRKLEKAALVGMKVHSHPKYDLRGDF